MNPRDLNRRAREQWDAKAEFWDVLHGYEGNQFHQLLVGPSAEKLLGVKAGESIVDVACGNGQFSRRLAELGAQVTATDFSAALIERAKARTNSDKVNYKVVDATDEAQLLALGIGQFDSAVCNMALQDIADIAPLFRAVRRLVKQGGRFVFTLTHPAFNLAQTVFVEERAEVNGEIIYTRVLKQSHYLTERTEEGAGAPNEPNPHLYFHRPMNVLLNAAFEAGWMADGIEEPAFPEGSLGGRRLSWAEFPEFPPVLAVRLR